MGICLRSIQLDLLIIKTREGRDESDIVTGDSVHFCGELSANLLANDEPEKIRVGVNLLSNGSFETPAMDDYYIVPKLEDKTYRQQDRKMFVERSTLKTKSGKYSLLCSSDFEKATNEINLNKLPFKSGEKYRFIANYFIGSSEGKVRFSGRVAYWNSQKSHRGHS